MYTLSVLYFVGLFVLITAALCVYTVALKKKDNSIMDRFYGLLVIKVSLVYLFIHSIVNPLCFGTELRADCIELHVPSIPLTVIVFFVCVWGLRLSWRIHAKNSGKGEDFRYAAWRKEWMKKGERYTNIRSLLQVFILQAIVVSIITLPVLIASVPQILQIGTLWYLGIFIWLIGFFFEAVGDYQLDSFIKSKPAAGSVLQTGLWSIVRHPNYFGEILMWTGIFLMMLFRYPGSYVAILSPFLIAYLLSYVSGVPLVEKRFEGNPEWEAYKKKTPAIFPRI
jgi:steroid 5-alpha reductase family enzyme